MQDVHKLLSGFLYHVTSDLKILRYILLQIRKISLKKFFFITEIKSHMRKVATQNPQ